MDQTPDAPQTAPAESKFPPIVRTIAIVMLVLILWSLDKLAVGRLPHGSPWRYFIGGFFITVGLATVLSFIDRYNGKNS